MCQRLPLRVSIICVDFARFAGSHSSACACTHHLQTGLLQLSISWRATVHSQRTAACPERCSSADFQSRAARPRQRQSDRTALAKIHWRIQYKLNVLMHGIITGMCPPDYLRTIVQPATSSHPGLRSASCIRHTATTHEVWRACLQLRRPIGVELTS